LLILLGFAPLFLFWKTSQQLLLICGDDFLGADIRIAKTLTTLLIFQVDCFLWTVMHARKTTFAMFAKNRFIFIYLSDICYGADSAANAAARYLLWTRNCGNTPVEIRLPSS
jgi:hypothetical protein